MALFTIYGNGTLVVDGVNFPTPKRGFKPTVITAVDSGRNANGAVVGQRVGRDMYKLDELEWPWLSADQWAFVLSVLGPYFVNVTFWSPVSNSQVTIKMYAGDRTAEPYWLDGNAAPAFYRNCKVNLIDCGE